MDLEAFKDSLKAKTPPPGLGKALESLWLAAKGDWDGAHNIAQDMHNKTGSAIHAYLHRVEGDLGNAAYWYRRAGLEKPQVDRRSPEGASNPEGRESLEAEWEKLTIKLLKSE